MGKKEIECIAVEINIAPLKEEDVKLIVEIAKRYKTLGVAQIVFDRPLFLFRANCEEDAEFFCGELKVNGFNYKLLNDHCFIPTKKENKIIEDFVCGKLLTRFKYILDKYCFSQEEDKKSYPFFKVNGDLGGRTCYFVILGINSFACGLENGKMRITHKARKEYDKVINDFENDILEWRENHSGVCKKL